MTGHKFSHCASHLQSQSTNTYGYSNPQSFAIMSSADIPLIHFTKHENTEGVKIEDDSRPNGTDFEPASPQNGNRGHFDSNQQQDIQRTPKAKRRRGKVDTVDHQLDEGDQSVTNDGEYADEDALSNDGDEQRPKAPTSEAIFMKEDAVSLGGARSPRTG